MNCPYCQTPIDKHEARRCLDAWIAEVVMNIKVRITKDAIGEYLPVAPDIYGSFYTGHTGEKESLIPLYSRDISAAWELIIKLTDKTQRGDMMALAICRAALKATEGIV